MLGIADGFFGARILFALLRLGVFEHLGAAARSAEELGALLDTPPERLARLLRAGVTLGVLEVSDQQFAIPADQRELLLREGSHSLHHWLRTLDLFCDALGDLDRAVSGAEPAIPLSARLGDQDDSTTFALAMHDYASLRGRELAHYLDTRGCRSLLDLGCGPGTYAVHLARANADLELHLFDRATVLETTRRLVGAADLAHPTHFHAGDATADPIPGPHDLVLISNMLHMQGESGARALLRRVHAALRPGGSVVVQGQFLADDRTGPRWPVFLDLVQLCTTDHGHNHTVDDTRAWLQAAGFDRFEVCPMSVYNTNSFIRAYRATESTSHAADHP